MNGLKALLDSKKGVTFASVAGVFGAMIAEGSLPAVEGARLITVMACVYWASQAITDRAKAKP